MAARLRLRHLWLLVPFWALALRSALPVRDNSFLWHVRAGIDQLAAGDVIRNDPYSFTRAGAPWRTQSWLVELGYGRLEAWFPGLGWVPWFLLAVMGATLAVVLAVLWSRNGGHLGVIVTLVTVGWLIQPYVQPRPVSVGLALLAVVGAVTAMRRPSLWAVPPLMWLWAAVHGSFVLGLVFLGLDAVRRRSRRQLLAVVLGAVAATLTAHGFGVWHILADFVANREGLSLIQEWRPPDFTTPWLAAFLVLLALLMAGLAAGRIPAAALWMVVPAVVLALTSARGVFASVLVLAPWLGDAAMVVPDRNETPASRFVVWATALAMAVTAVVLLTGSGEVDDSLFPTAEAVAAVGDGPVFTSVGVAGFLLYSAEGRRVFIDDRVELYGADFLTRYQRAADGQEWRRLFAEHDIRQALLEVGGPLLDRLGEDGWVACHRDATFVVVAVTCG